MRHFLLNNMFFSALERTFTKKLTFEGMQVEKRIARIGSNDLESHLGIPYSHVSASHVSCQSSDSLADLFIILTSSNECLAYLTPLL